MLILLPLPFPPPLARLVGQVNARVDTKGLRTEEEKFVCREIREQVLFLVSFRRDITFTWSLGNEKGDETRFFPSFIIKEKKEKDGAEGS